LKDTAEDTGQLLELGRQWLSKVPQGHESWLPVWRRLFEERSDDPELAELGRAWLRRASVENPCWVRVWTTIWRSTPGEPELVSFGKAYLRDLPARTRTWYPWYLVWTTLTQSERSRDLPIGSRFEGVIRCVGKRHLSVSLGQGDLLAYMAPHVAMALEPTSLKALVGWKGEFVVLASDDKQSWVAPVGYSPEDPICGRTYPGLVTNVVDYGVFVATRVGTGLLHVSSIPDRLRGHLDEHFLAGQHCYVLVRSFDTRGRLNIVLVS